MTRIGFLPDAATEVGWGHVARCLALSEALVERGARCEFLVAATDGGRAFLEARGASVRIVPDANPARVTASDFSLVVVDGYRWSHDEVAVLAAGRRSAAVEDAPNHWPVDIVINPNLYAEHLYDAHASGPRLAVGPRFALVRSEVRLGAEGERGRTTARPLSPRARVLMTTGGVDPTNVAARVLAALAASDLPVLDVRVATSEVVSSRAVFAPAVANARTRHRVEVIDPSAFVSALAWAEVVVSAASGACLEAAVFGIPGVVVPLTANQQPVAREASARGMFTRVVDDEIEAGALTSALGDILWDEARRNAMVAAQRAAVDGEGSRRAAAILWEALETSA